MAIQLDLDTSNFGVPFQGAYFRIVQAALTRQRAENPRHNVMIDIVGYAAKPENEDTKDVDFRRYFAASDEVYAQSGDNFLAQCYTWVMAQPDMVGSVGV